MSEIADRLVAWTRDKEPIDLVGDAIELLRSVTKDALAKPWYGPVAGTLVMLEEAYSSRSKASISDMSNFSSPEEEKKKLFVFANELARLSKKSKEIAYITTSAEFIGEAGRRLLNERDDDTRDLFKTLHMSITSLNKQLREFVVKPN